MQKPHGPAAESKVLKLLATSAVAMLLTGCGNPVSAENSDTRIYFSHSTPTIGDEGESSRSAGCNVNTPNGSVADGLSDSKAQLVLYFLNDKSTLGTGELERLQSFVLASMDDPSVSYLITGHTDSVHTSVYNAQLSIERADQVLSSMIHMGVPINQLAVKAAGETAPVASNKTAEGRQLNRRVTVEAMPPNPTSVSQAWSTRPKQAYDARLPSNPKPACLAFASGVKEK